MAKQISLYVMAAIYLLAGINHFWHPVFYKKIMPAYIAWHMPLIYASGVAEIALAILLIPQGTRAAAAWLIIAMLAVFMIVHVQMLIDYWNKGPMLFWIALLRIPLQFILVWWAWIYTRGQ